MTNRWEHQDAPPDDLPSLEAEFRERLLTERGKALVEARGMTDDERAALNAAVAERVLGWSARTETDGMAPKGSGVTRTVWVRPDGTRTRRLSDFAGDWAAAGEVLDYFDRYTLEKRAAGFVALVGRDTLFGAGEGQTAAEAIARACLDWAALRAAGAREGE